MKDMDWERAKHKPDTDTRPHEAQFAESVIIIFTGLALVLIFASVYKALHP